MSLSVEDKLLDADALDRADDRRVGENAAGGLVDLRVDEAEAAVHRVSDVARPRAQGRA